MANPGDLIRRAGQNASMGRRGSGPEPAGRQPAPRRPAPAPMRAEPEPVQIPGETGGMRMVQRPVGGHGALGEMLRRHESLHSRHLGGR